ncbi:hypothetical protein BAUCODRAFT_74984 [Baudoinia panamericana UAMH 10762]|uniref:Anaphase-promoting complex subunit 4 WD40 domain-containing protein n=1 Tax=Baudoinia panamericana (strain UAMH 10762) TaxID=717646 RepID=M2MRE7_BAUPA|nr:uncharacterized protein BAUCODRAFT_74984 [Baudoinia panamericana UAMH 10762]EMC94023.1 hypothetical protein BAUCODRAFT_74984 [Baudoinia panamericana UAMH 10762]
MSDQHEANSLTDEQADALLDMDDAEEMIEHDEDAAMDSGDEDGEDGEDVDVEGPLEEIQLQNDSVAHFDAHKDSIYCIAQHPLRPEIVATGGGDDIAYIWDSTPVQPGTTANEGPVLPKSYESNPQPTERQSQPILSRLDQQDETVNAITFLLPSGDYIATGTLAGKLNVYLTLSTTTNTLTPQPAHLHASVKEVESIEWILPSPHKTYTNTFALGASDGSVWIYTVQPTTTTSNSNNEAPLILTKSFFLHQAPCTAGAWTPDGKLLATVSEDSSLYVWDVFGEAAAAGLTASSGSEAIVALTAADERFRVDGGLYSVAISPGGGIVAVGGAEGQIRVVGLPRLSATNSSTGTTGAKGAGARSKTGGAKQAPAPAAASAGQTGQILASLQAQSDGIETLSFSQPPLTLLAAGSVDGSIALFDAAHNFALRRHIPAAHEEEAVIQVEFVKTPLGTVNERGWVLTSGGNDGVVRRWDVRGGSTGTGTGGGGGEGQGKGAGKGLVGEWRGHRGGGDGGGVMGFVQGGFGGGRVVTAGDDGVGLVFEVE